MGKSVIEEANKWYTNYLLVTIFGEGENKLK